MFEELNCQCLSKSLQSVYKGTRHKKSSSFTQNVNQKIHFLKLPIIAPPELSTENKNLKNGILLFVCYVTIFQIISGVSC